MSRNIVLVVLDTVRRDYFERYAPRLAGRSDASFTQFRAAGSWSVPCHASMFTGRLPSQHDLHAERFGAGLDLGAALAGETFLPELDGYSTLGVSSNIYMNEEFGFDGLFDEFRDHSIGNHWHSAPFPEARTDFEFEAGPQLRKYAAGLSQALDDDYPARSVVNGLWAKYKETIESLPVPRLGDNGARVNSDAIREYAADADEPFFIFANYMDAHNPLENSVQYDRGLHSVSNAWSSNEFDKWELLLDDSSTEEYTSNYRALYGAAVEYLDRVVDDLIEDLESVTGRETTVIVTADHGHNLGYDYEDGYFHHTTSLSEGVLHVPFEVYNPPAAWPDRITERVSQITLPRLVRAIRDERWDKTVIDEFAVVAENIGLLGQGDGIDHETADEADAAFWSRMIRCGYLDDEKYEWDSLGRTRRFTIDRERPCWQSLVETGCDIPDRLRATFDEELSTYKEHWRRQRQALEFEDDVAENLRDLGYL